MLYLPQDNKTGKSLFLQDLVSMTKMFRTRDPNIVGSTPVMDHLACDLGQVALVHLPRPLNET
jgi:hypothetical protein